MSLSTLNLGKLAFVRPPPGGNPEGRYFWAPIRSQSVITPSCYPLLPLRPPASPNRTPPAASTPRRESQSRPRDEARLQDARAPKPVASLPGGLRVEERSVDAQHSAYVGRHFEIGKRGSTDRERPRGGSRPQRPTEPPSAESRSRGVDAPTGTLPQGAASSTFS